ncbi:MAG: chemotaxis protein CheB, partial [bacterium]
MKAPKKTKAMKPGATSAGKPGMLPEETQIASPAQAPAETDAVPAADFPIVGIGASAGGLAAFEAFFSGMPSDVDPGMAFVLVQHL